MRTLARILCLTFMLVSWSAMAREQIRVVGSSTVFPFSTSVAEYFGKIYGLPTPIVEENGTGGGFALFCAGAGEDTPDIINASRAIKASEAALCKKNNVRDIVEIRIGYDGIVLGHALAAADMALTRQQIYMALAKKVPVDGALVSNPYKTWRDIDAKLPDEDIKVYGPPPSSGTRDALVDMVMLPGCSENPVIKALPEKDKHAACATVREDGVYVQAGENDNLIIQRLATNATAIGIFGYSFLDHNQDVVKPVAIDGVAPAFDSIIDGRYPVSRPLYIYAKKAHVGIVKGLKDFLTEYTSENAIGDDGYLVEKGLIPLLMEQRDSERDKAEGLVTIVLP